MMIDNTKNARYNVFVVFVAHTATTARNKF